MNHDPAAHRRPHDRPERGPGHSDHHDHGIVDPAIASTRRGMWALKRSFVGLLATALLQVVVVVLATATVANNIVVEASLTFVGLGVRPDLPSWGNMLADGRDYLAVAWWMGIFPGLALMLTVLTINLLGDWLRDYLDPTLRSV